MDIVSHALWGGIALGRVRRRDYASAFVLGALPDLLGEGVMFTVAALAGTLPSSAHGHPQITEFPVFLQSCYNATHSLTVFAALFLAASFVRRRPAWLLLAWALHIVLDIPTHALALFPTPFLWPLSDARVDGIPWRSASILIPNAALLILAHGAWYAHRRRHPSAARPRTKAVRHSGRGGQFKPGGRKSEDQGSGIGRATTASRRGQPETACARGRISGTIAGLVRTSGPHPQRLHQRKSAADRIAAPARSRAQSRIDMQLNRLDAEDIDLIVKTLKEFTQHEAPLDRRLKWDESDTCPADVVREMLGPDVGLHLVFLPADYGGMGGGAYDVYRLSAEFAKIDLGLATAMLAVALGTDPIRVGCTHEQKTKWISRIAEQGLVVAYGVTEPEAGSNVQNLKTEATPITDASGTVTHYRLNGVKQFISNGSIADLYTILAKAPGGPTFFVVERNTPGLTPGRHEIKHGIRLSDTAQVLLQDVVIPADNIVGEREGEGLKQANEVFGFTRLMVAAFGLGAGQAALDRAIAYSKQRKQFGTYLAEKQGYTHKLLVPNSVRLAAAQAYIEYVADLLDSGNTDRQVEGSVAKLFATEAGNVAADQALQALGGYGYCVDFEVEKIRRDARILTIYEGTSEIQQSIIGLFRMRETVRSKGQFYARMADEMEPLANEGGPAVARAARFLADAAQTAFRAKLMRQQYVSFEFATAMADVETAVALSRAASKKDDALLKAQARIWGSQVALGVPSRLLAALSASESVSADDMSRLHRLGDLDGGIALQAGRLADMNLVAEKITGLRVAE